MDLTTLNDDDTDAKVIALCRQANSPAGTTAAICIYPRFIPVARKALREQGTPEVRIATVTNFPHGNDDIDIALADTILGSDWADARHFRFGASSLLTSLLQATGHQVAASTSSY